VALKDPAADLVTFLTGKTLGGVALVSGTNLFSSGLRPDDQTTSPAVFCLNSGGPEATAYLGGNREAFHRPTVQVMIRGGAAAFAAGETLARGVFDELYLAAPTGYVELVPRDSQPAYLGDDEANRGQWVINLECHWSD
jgi:hypothetical protein